MFTEAEIATALVALIKDHPTGKYDYQAEPDGCAYQPTDANPTGCIVGLLFREYLGDEGRTVYETKLWRTGETIDGILGVGGTVADQNALDLLRKVQGMQDEGVPWATALAEVGLVERQGTA